MCEIDYDPVELWSERPVRARKQHRCDGCAAVIRVGEVYLSHFHVFDGNARSESCCFACWAAREQFKDAHGTYCTPWNLMEALRDCIGENDDPEDEWRPVLASILARYRTSPSGRMHLYKLWAARPI